MNEKFGLNIATIEKLRVLQNEGESDIVIELMDAFFESIPQRLMAMNDFLGKKKFAAIAREAHSIKSSALMLGAEKLGFLCGQMEDEFASEGKISNPEATVQRVQIEFDNACKQLRAYRHRACQKAS